MTYPFDAWEAIAHTAARLRELEAAGLAPETLLLPPTVREPEPEVLARGDAVLWLVGGGTGRRNWKPLKEVPATVREIGPVKVCIQVTRRNGTRVLRWVSRERLVRRAAG
jgi:hypothetical protein